MARALALAWVHLAVLWAFAVAKPLFDVLADSPEFFVARGNTRGDILLFSFALVLLPPTALALVELALYPLGRVRRIVHLIFVGGLAAALALQVADDLLGAPSGVLVAIAAVIGAGVGLAYAATRFVPSMLTVLGPAPLVFLAIFLLLSPVSDLVLPQQIEEAAATRVTSKTPVVFLVFDEFDPNMLMDRRERIDASRYPGFAELARDGTWYRNATTVNSATTLAVPALLSGRRSPGDALPTQEDFPNSVFTLLGGSYEFHVEELATQLCPERLCGSRARGTTVARLRSLTKDLGIVSLHLLLPEGLRSGLPAVDRTFGNFQTGGRDRGKPARGGDLGPPASSVLDRVDAARRFIRDIEPEAGQPSFHFAHLVLPHVPWQYLPSGQEYPPSEPDIPGLRGEIWDDQPVFSRLGLQRHLLQVGYADRLLGELLRRLRETGVYDRALVVVAADHGVSYRPGEPRRAPTARTLSDIAAVPLFIKYPGQRRGVVDDAMVRTIDVVPTIAHVLGVRMPYKAEGRPIRPGRDMSGTVAVDSGRNAPVTAPFASFIRARQAGLRRILSLFGSDDGGVGLYATGLDRDLLGKRVRGLVTTTAGSPGRVDFAEGETFNRVDPRAPVVPSLLSGRIRGEVEPGTPIAVAVNGRISGVSETFSAGGETRLAVMVPPTAYRRGPNRVDVLTIDRAGGAPRLTALDVARVPQYRIVDRDGEQVLAGGGRELPIADGNVEGFVDSLEREGAAIRVGGWAASAAAKRPAARVLVFAGDRVLAQGVPDLDREDVAAKLKSSAVTRSGYAFRLSGAGLDPDDIRVVAVYGDGASELPVYDR